MWKICDCVCNVVNCDSVLLSFPNVGNSYCGDRGSTQGMVCQHRRWSRGTVDGVCDAMATQAMATQAVELGRWLWCSVDDYGDIHYSSVSRQR